MVMVSPPPDPRAALRQARLRSRPGNPIRNPHFTLKISIDKLHRRSPCVSCVQSEKLPPRGLQ
jgi:hypothetical protein